MTSLVLGHFVNRVVDGIQVQGLGTCGDALLVFASAAFGSHALFQVRLRIPYAVAQQFGELGGVFSLFPSVTLVCLGDFGITLAVGLTAHGQIHADFGAFAHEVVVQVLDHFVIAALGYADHVFIGKYQRTIRGLFFNFHKLAGRSLAEGALLGSGITFVNVTAYCTSEFLHFLFSLMN